jgi:S1-C subfamily serine protease
MLGIFAVPSNIARKIIEDLMEYGNVQRAILGVEGELNATASKALGINRRILRRCSDKKSGAENLDLKKEILS